MHLQRALLLFAIVLGLAAVAASLSRTDRNRSERAAPEPEPTTTETTAPAPLPRLDPLRFVQGPPPEVRRLKVGRAATVTVTVRRAGQAEIRGLGATKPAEPATPATFDVYRSEPGTFPVLLRPAAGGRAETLGVLRVR